MGSHGIHYISRFGNPDKPLFATWNWVGSRSEGSHENVAGFSVAIDRRKILMMIVYNLVKSLNFN